MAARKTTQTASRKRAAKRRASQQTSLDEDLRIEQEVRAASDPSLLQSAPRREMTRAKDLAKRGGRNPVRAKSTRVSNPKRSSVDQASKRPGARRVDGRAARA